jgi:DNA-binding transcriptional ArsR family regulator
MMSPPASPLPHLFAALADPTRLRVLALLRAMELSVGEIAQVLGQASRACRATSRSCARPG